MHASCAAGYILSNHLRQVRSSRIFNTTGGMGASSQKFAHSSHLEKKFPFPHGKIPDPLSSVPPNTKFLFPQQVSQSLRTGYRHIEKQHWGWTITMVGIGGLEQGPNSQGNLQIRWYCLFWQILQVSYSELLNQKNISWWLCLIKWYM